MSSYLKRYSLFRSARSGHEGPTAAADPAAAREVIEVDDLDGFASVSVRPMTYAEAARGASPPRGVVVAAQSPFSTVDEAQWAVNEVQRYIQECEARSPPHASTHVTTNQEYLDRADVVDRQYLHSKRGRRASSKRRRAVR